LGLTAAFSLSVALIGPVGRLQNDPLSLWMVHRLSLDSMQQFSYPNGIPMAYTLLDWVLCLSVGMLVLMGFARWKMPVTLAAAAGLATAAIGLVVIFFASAGVLLSTSAPLLCIAFGLLSGYVLLRLLPETYGASSECHAPLQRHAEEILQANGPAPAKDPLASEDGFFSPPPSGAPKTETENHSGSKHRQAIGRYEIIRPIGKGAMGEVFLGRDPHINRLTAIKTVHFEENFAEEDIEQIKGKFFREAESAGTLSHPHIVTIYDAGEDGDIAYIAMELLEGSTLLRFARRQHLLPLRRLIRYMMQVAEALAYAHSQGVIHRDIKPANIILTQSGQIKLTDFGIAHIATSSQTQTGVVKGTPYYMSPEQFSGRKVDGRSDIFSLGTTLFQLLTGTLPFYAESPALLMNQIMNFPHPNPRAINPRIVPAMVAIVDKALAKDRDDRYQSAKALARDLGRLDSRIKTALRQGHRRSP